MPSGARHPLPDQRQVGFGGGTLVDEFTARHHEYPVGHGEQLIQVSLTSSTAAPRFRASINLSWTNPPP